MKNVIHYCFQKGAKKDLVLGWHVGQHDRITWIIWPIIADTRLHGTQPISNMEVVVLWSGSKGPAISLYFIVGHQTSQV